MYWFIYSCVCFIHLSTVYVSSFELRHTLSAVCVHFSGKSHGNGGATERERECGWTWEIITEGGDMCVLNQQSVAIKFCVNIKSEEKKWIVCLKNAWFLLFFVMRKYKWNYKRQSNKAILLKFRFYLMCKHVPETNVVIFGKLIRVVEGIKNTDLRIFIFLWKKRADLE